MCMCVCACVCVAFAKKHGDHNYRNHCCCAHELGGHTTSCLSAAAQPYPSHGACNLTDGQPLIECTRRPSGMVGVAGPISSGSLPH